MDTMKKLFNGEIYPFETMSQSKESIQIEYKLAELLEKADEKIPRENGEFFSDTIRAYISDHEAIAAEQAFAIGFSLGLKITTECYRDI